VGNQLDFFLFFFFEFFFLIFFFFFAKIFYSFFFVFVFFVFGQMERGTNAGRAKAGKTQTRQCCSKGLCELAQRHANADSRSKVNEREYECELISGCGGFLSLCEI